MELKNKTLETIFAIIISITLILIGTYYMKMFFFLYPVFFIILGSRYGINHGLLSLIISSIIIKFMTDTASAIFIFIAFAPLALSIIYAFRKRKDSFVIITTSTALFLLSVLLIIGITKNLTGVGMVNEVEEALSQVLDYQVEMFKGAGMSNYELLRIKELLGSAYDYLILIMPSIIMIFTFAIAYINYLLSALSLRRLEHGIVTIPKFSRFKLPNNILVGTGIMFLGAFILTKVRLQYYQAVFVNLSVIVTFLFLIQGLSVIDYMMIKKGIKRILRIIIIVVSTMIIALGWIIPLIGIFDAIFDFRKLRKAI